MVFLIKVSRRGKLRGLEKGGYKRIDIKGVLALKVIVDELVRTS